VKFFLHILLTFCFILSFLFPRQVFAFTYFEDDFSANLDKWTRPYDGYSLDGNENPIVGTYGWYLSEGILKGEAGYYERSYLYPNIGTTLTSFEFQVEMENKNGVDQSFWFFASPDHLNFYEINFRFDEPDWSQDHNNITLSKSVNGTYVRLDTAYGKSENNPNKSLDFDITQNERHEAKVVFDAGHIKIYFDSVLVIDYVEVNLLNPGAIVFRNWGGAFYQGSYGRVLNHFYHIKVTSVGGEEDKDKVIIVPGLGASWNSEAMLTGVTGPALEWKLPTFVKNYDALVDTLKNKGYKDESMVGVEEDPDLYVWAYDWRRPLEEIVGNFHSFVNEKIASNEKFSIVGHSLGGLVGRMWAQANSTDSRLQKVISLGSPHQGAIKAYKAWNGADFGGGLSGIALNVLLQLHKKDFPYSSVEAVQNFSPSLKDILPIFNFARRGGDLVPYSDLNTVNDYLQSMNVSSGGVIPLLTTVAGWGVRTDEYMSLGSRNFFDRLLNKWVDGRPINYQLNSLGDGTVLKKSAVLTGATEELVPSTHGQVVDQSIALVLNELGLDLDGIVAGKTVDLSKAIVFSVASPVSLDVSCNGGISQQSDETGWLVVENDGSINQCQVNVLPVGNGGRYHLVAGKVDDDQGWQYFEDEVGSGQTKSYSFKISADKLILSGGLATMYDLVKKDCQNLLVDYSGDEDLLACVDLADQRNYLSLVDRVFSFRGRQKELVVSQRIIVKLEDILSMELANGSSLIKAQASLKQVKIERSLVERVERLKEAKGMALTSFGAVNYDKALVLIRSMEELINKAEYSRVEAEAKLVDKYFRLLW